MPCWSERTWLITGASSGLGKAMAQAVLRAGGRVVAWVRDPASVADWVGKANGRALSVAADVTRKEQLLPALHQSRSRHHGGHGQ